MPEPISLEHTSAQLLLKAPEMPTQKAAIILPGVSGGVFSERYRPLVDALHASNIAAARLQSYADAEELKQKTIDDLHADIDAAIRYLQARGYTSLFGIGKSFGGALLLTDSSDEIARKVLWAPAIAAMERGSNFESYRATPVGSIRMMMDVRIDRAFVEKINTPTLVIHGTADDQIPFSNSEQIVSMLPHARLAAVDGADHSYKNPEHERAVVAASVNFLTSV